MKKYFLYLLAALPLLFTSCSDDDDPVDVTVRLNQTDLTYSADGVWEGVNTNNTFQSQYMVFSHEGETSAWGLLWNGFTPARVSDTTVQSDWLSHQFQIMTGGGMAGKGTPYIVAFWDTQENFTTPADERSCRITYQKSATDAPQPFRPLSVYVQNTAYAYYTMLEGNNYAKKFGPEDYLILRAYGVHADGTYSGTMVYLARDGKIVDDWTLFDLSSLGEVNEIFFTMESSDEGQWGMNTPSYFALDCLTVRMVLP